MHQSHSNRFPIGDHVLVLEGGANAKIILHGELTLNEAETLSNLIAELAKSLGSISLLVDASRFINSDAHVRRALAEGRLSGQQVRACAVFGAPFPVRITIHMIMKASLRLFPNRFGFPFEIAASESHARAFLAKHREDAAPMSSRGRTRRVG